MAKGVQSARRRLHPAQPLKITPHGDKAVAAFEKVDRGLEKKGFFPESTHLQQKQEQKEQKEQIALRRQQETARLAEAESEVSRKRFLAKAGGRRSLIASR